jgi:RNA polymerase sigma-70 factor (ECF subfamily)
MEAVDAMSTERVWSELHASIHGFVRRRVREPADVDDIVQRIFLQVHRSLPQLRDADRLHGWLYRTARRAIADHYRAPARRREVPAGGAGDVVPEEGLRSGDAREDEASAMQELAGCLPPLLAGLAETDREALRLIEVDGVTQTEAARRLGLSVSGMKSRVQRARVRLRTLVEACCRVELDRRGGLITYEPQSGSDCGGCRPACEPQSAPITDGAPRSRRI